MVKLVFLFHQVHSHILFVLKLILTFRWAFAIVGRVDLCIQIGKVDPASSATATKGLQAGDKHKISHQNWKVIKKHI